MLKYLTLLSVLIIGRIVHGQSEIEGRVIKVSEGDIIEMVTATQDTLTVRLSNVDCPENGQAYYDEAKRYTEKMCLKKKIRFISSGTGGEGVEEGRLLLNNDRVLNIELVKEGLAWHLRKGLQMSSDTQQLNEGEELARTSKKGLWSVENPLAPWVYKRNLNRFEAKSSY